MASGFPRLSVWQSWIVLTLLALLAGLWLLASADPTAKPAMPPCMRNLKMVGLAICQYHEDYGCLPPAVALDAEGRPMHSWRALIAPYLRDAWDHEAGWLEARARDSGFWQSREFYGRAAAARTKARQLQD